MVSKEDMAGILGIPVSALPPSIDALPKTLPEPVQPLAKIEEQPVAKIEPVEDCLPKIEVKAQPEEPTPKKKKSKTSKS